MLKFLLRNVKFAYSKKVPQAWQPLLASKIDMQDLPQP